MTHARYFILLLLLYVTLAYAFSEVIPFNKGPDEGYNLNYINFISTHGRLPITYTERQEIGAKANWPPLYHLMVAALTTPITHTPRVGGTALEVAAIMDALYPPQLPHIKLFWDSFRYRALDVASNSQWYLLSEDQLRPYYGPIWVLHVGRWLAILCGGLTLGLIYLTLLELTSDWQAVAGISFLAFLPAFVFITSSMNEDGLVALFVAMYFWRLVKLIKSPFFWRDYVFIGLLIGLSITVKYTTVILPLEITVIILILAQQHSKNWLWVGQRLLLTGLSTLLGVSWWIAWNVYYLNKVAELGGVAGLLAPFSTGVNISIARLGNYLSGGQVGMAAIPEQIVIGTWWQWLSGTFLSFWGVTINGTMPYFYISYAIIALTLMLITWGIAQHWRNQPEMRGWLGLALGHVGFIFILPMFNFALSRRIGATAQGRHIFIPAATALILLAVWGLTTAIPKRWHGLTFGLLTVGLMGWSVAHWQQLRSDNDNLLPFRTLPASVAFLTSPFQTNFDDKIQLSSYEIMTTPTHLKLQFAWRALTTLNENYQFRVTLLDTTNKAVAMWQGYHGQGRVPTLTWDSDMVIFDRLTLPWPSTGTPPYQVQIEIIGHDGLWPKKAKIYPLINAPNLRPPILNQSLILDTQTISYTVWSEKDIFRYPATILLLLPALSSDITVELLDSHNQAWPPTSHVNGMYNFVIGPRWSSGAYRLRLNRRDNPVTSEPILTVENWWPRHFAPPEPIAVPQTANFANQLQFLGYTLLQNQVKAGEALPVTLYWQAPADKAPQADFIQFNHLLDSSGQPHGGYERRPLEYYSTLLWSPGEVVADGYTIPVAADAPPGQYYLDVGYYINVGGSAVNLPLVIDGKMSDISHVTIGPIEVVR